MLVYLSFHQALPLVTALRDGSVKEEASGSVPWDSLPPLWPARSQTASSQIHLPTQPSQSTPQVFPKHLLHAGATLGPIH